LSKFAIVAVLSLGGAALSQSTGHSLTGVLAGIAMLTLGAFAPWVLLRLLPLAEIASGAVGSVRGELRAASGASNRAGAWGEESHDWSTRTAQMRHDAEAATPRDAASAQKARLDESSPGSEPRAAATDQQIAAVDSQDATSSVPAAQPVGVAPVQAPATDAPVAPTRYQPPSGSEMPAARPSASVEGTAESASGAPAASADTPPSEAKFPVIDLEQPGSFRIDLGDGESHDPTPPPQRPEHEG
jgi:hypothetical protein